MPGQSYWYNLGPKLSVHLLTDCQAVTWANAGIFVTGTGHRNRIRSDEKQATQANGANSLVRPSISGRIYVVHDTFSFYNEINFLYVRFVG